MCISTQQLVRMFDGGDWDKSYSSSGIWDGKNDSTIGNEMASEWTDSGKRDGRKSVKVGNGMESAWADSGTGREWTGTVHLAVGRETRKQKSVTGEVGKHRSGKEISRPFPFPYRPDLYPAEPWYFMPGIQFAVFLDT